MVIDKEDVPNSYFALLEKIARERGQEFNSGLNEARVNALRKDQTESLREWSDYLRSDENGHVYPDWFKVYAWESLKKMGELDKDKGKFKKRTKSTTAPWPELNAEALAYVYDSVDNGVIRGESIEDNRLASLLNNGNFATLYAHALFHSEVNAITPEMREVTGGSWVKYPQIEGKYEPHYAAVDGEYVDETSVDNETAMELAQSLRGKNTGWCTAGVRTAAHQLSMGDFYVYYTEDKDGKDTVPRIAIRMENGQVTEVRGIEPDQNLEANMTDIVAEKLKTLPGGDKYNKRVKDMKRVTELDEQTKRGDLLSLDDVKFLHDADGFGWYEDSRIYNILDRVGCATAKSVIDRFGVSSLKILEAIKEDCWNAYCDELVGLLIDRAGEMKEGDIRTLWRFADLEEGRDDEAPWVCYISINFNEKIVAQADKFFVGGVSIARIFEHRSVYKEVMRYRESQYVGQEDWFEAEWPSLAQGVRDDCGGEIAEKLIKVGAEPDFTKGLLKVMRHFEGDDGRYSHFPYVISDKELQSALDELDCSNETKERIVEELKNNLTTIRST